MEIKVNVDKQKLKIATNLKTFISGTQEFIKFSFNFMDSTWNGLTISAQFRQGNTVYSEKLENNSVYLPSEIVAGECLLTLYGARNNVIAITDSLKLTIENNNVVANPENTKMSNSLYDQLVSEYEFEDLKTSSKTIIGAINELYNMVKKL